MQFVDGDVSISQVQILSNQSKISTRIELFMGSGPDYLRANFSRLGYLSLDTNERSAYKARELKSVYLKSRGVFMKFVLHKCHVNHLNLHNQVALVALNILGRPNARQQQGGGGGYPPNAFPGMAGSLIPRPSGVAMNQAHPGRCVHALLCFQCLAV